MSAATRVELYTDGACSGNPGPGGWGAILVARGHEKPLSGGESPSTNNRMELTAVIEGLRALKRRCQVTITTDSTYVVNGFRKDWIGGWKKRAKDGVWMTSQRQPVANQELWEQLIAEVEKHDVTWAWVKGHSDHSYNERCDRMAVAAAAAAAS